MWMDEEDVLSRFAIGASECFDELTPTKHETEKERRHLWTRSEYSIGRGKTVEMRMEMKMEPSFSPDRFRVMG